MNIRGFKAVASALGLTLALSGCVSFGEDPPAQLLTLTAATTAPVGTATNGPKGALLAVMEPTAPRALDVNRVPVQVDASSIAYLQDAVWVDKPTRLFQMVLAETIRSNGKRLVVDLSDLQYSASTSLSGQLLAMGYDAGRSGVLVRYDAIVTEANGTVRARRFEHFVGGVPAEAAAVGAALNEASNAVAGDVAAWVG